MTQATYSTRWSLIVRAQGSGPDTRRALGELLSSYEKFVVWLIRHYKHPPDTNPEELKQEFIEDVLRRNDIAKLDRARGSFRGWLGLAVRRFLMNEWDKWKASSAGRQGTIPLGLDLDLALEQAPPDDGSEREFACHVVRHALALQRRETRDVKRFDTLARFLPGPQMDLVELSPLATSLGMTQNALAKAICLMGARFREVLREAVSDVLDLGRELEPGLDRALRVEAEGRQAARIDE